MSRTHQLGVDRARAAAQQVGQELQRELGLKSQWVGELLQFEGSGVKGVMRVAEDRIDIEVALSFLLKAMRPMIEAAIAKRLDELLPSQIA